MIKEWIAEYKPTNEEETLSAMSDPQTFKEHVLVDFSDNSQAQIKNKAKKQDKENKNTKRKKKSR